MGSRGGTVAFGFGPNGLGGVTTVVGSSVCVDGSTSVTVAEGLGVVGLGLGEGAGTCADGDSGADDTANAGSSVCTWRRMGLGVVGLGGRMCEGSVTARARGDSGSANGVSVTCTTATVSTAGSYTM